MSERIVAGSGQGPDVSASRLPAEDYLENFSDLHPLLEPHDASVEADRCYFCYDAPCTIACPTSIDIPLFIRQISTNNELGAAQTIFEQNILGGMCARVCPVETLCEQACVREAAEGKPVKIGMLQRYATDAMMETGEHPFERSEPTGRKVAVVGGGPAGLSCAHRLARYGHDITIFDARPKAGGLNEYGIAAYKTVDEFAQKEVEFITSIGGITVETGKELGRDLTLADLRRDFDAVFLAIGLGGVNALQVGGAEATSHAVDFISDVRQADDLGAIPVGRHVIVIGGGMTAIDAAVQSRLLGADDVTIVYRRGKDAMNASSFEQDLAQTNGVKIRHWSQPKRVILNADGQLSGLELERTRERDGRLETTGETYELKADMVLTAIGQTFNADHLNGSGRDIVLEHGRIAVDDDRRTSLPDVWAGGDCVAGGDDLTVVAVEDGKIAAENMHRALIG